YELAERYGISKSPIREAFRLLEQEGLVTAYPRRGVTVTKINRRDIEELYAIRACLLALQVRLVAEKATDADLKELDEAFEAMRQAADRPDVKGYFDANIVFHDLLSGIADNRKLAQLLQVSGKQTLRFRYLSLTVPQRIPESLAQHAQVLEALRLRDSAAAERAITELIESTRRAIVDRYLRETRGVEESLFLSDRVHVMSARPGTIKAEVAVPFRKPRTYEVLGSPEFGTAKQKILELIYEEVAKGEE
ncbi:MAG: FCD domain-containing protein, partial [Candidatus Rokuibacteriota bacterium]